MRTLSTFTRIAVVLAALVAAHSIAANLEDCFKSPPDSARPWVYWYWMQANATSDGITRDLEAMAGSGIGGAYLMPIGNAGKRTLADPPANPLSEHWWKLVVHAGRNTLAIDVTNTWRNRLIGDAGLPVEDRTTWTWRQNERWLDPKEPLDLAGLTGIVMLKTARPVKFTGQKPPSHNPKQEQPE